MPAQSHRRAESAGVRACAAAADPRALSAALVDAFAIRSAYGGYLTLFAAERFTEHDVALAGALAPHAAAALRRVRVRVHGGPAPRPSDDRPAVVVVGASGEVVSADPRALARLAGLGHDADGPWPAVVQVLAGRARQG